MNEENMPDWASIVDRHAERVARIAFRILGSSHDAEDVAQEVFAEALSVHRSGWVRTWTGLFVRLATLRSIDRLRRKQKSVEVTLPEFNYPAISCPPDQNLIASELAQWLRNEIRKLPEQQAAIFSMAYFEELSRNDIASALDLTPEAVSTNLYKARKTLSARMAVNQEKSL